MHATQGTAKKVARQIAAASLLEMLLASVPAHEFLARASPLQPADTSQPPQLSLVRTAFDHHCCLPPAAGRMRVLECKRSWSSSKRGSSCAKGVAADV
jgi:hypothetical protein